MVDLFSAFRVASSGIDVQTKRLNIVAQNLANVNTTSNVPGGIPYIRKTISFKTMVDPDSDNDVSELAVVSSYSRDKISPFRLKYMPSHPAADEDGYVKYPNVNEVIEMADSKDAQSAYQANLASLVATKNMISKILEILNSR